MTRMTKKSCSPSRFSHVHQLLAAICEKKNKRKNYVKIFKKKLPFCCLFLFFMDFLKKYYLLQASVIHWCKALLHSKVLVPRYQGETLPVFCPEAILNILRSFYIKP